MRIFLPGLLPVLSFASLTVRPLFYNLFEDHVLKSSFEELRPSFKSIILGLLPGIEDETSEDFERGISVLDRLRTKDKHQEEQGDEQELSGGRRTEAYFWQCFFLAIITSDGRRQGALAYLSRRLPSFKRKTRISNQTCVQTTSNGDQALDCEQILTPEPGLLVRSFAAGLNDSNILVQRGFLDILVSHIPLDSHLLQHVIQEADLDLLVAAAASVVLRRDMSLNRRLWAWFLGPEPTMNDTAPDGDVPSTTSAEASEPSGGQAAYFQSTVSESLLRCIFAGLQELNVDAATRAKPFRICSALMDRWEIGGFLIPNIFVTAMQAAYRDHQSAVFVNSSEVTKSASIFFDGIESGLIWRQIIDQIITGLSKLSTGDDSAKDCFNFIRFMTSNFNIREEDMQTRFIPDACIVILSGICIADLFSYSSSSNCFELLLDLVEQLLAAIPQQVLIESSSTPDDSLSDDHCRAIAGEITAYYKLSLGDGTISPPRHSRHEIGNVMQHFAAQIFILCTRQLEAAVFIGRAADVFTLLVEKRKTCSAAIYDELASTVLQYATVSRERWQILDHGFLAAAASSHIWSTLSEFCSVPSEQLQQRQKEILPALFSFSWPYLTPAVPKNHVEAVRLIWRLHQSVANTGAVDLTVLICERLLNDTSRLDDHLRFMVFWEQTVPLHVQRSDRRPSTLIRKTSVFGPSLDVTTVEVEVILRRPLLMLLDALDEARTELHALIAVWLRNLSSLDRVFSILLNALQVEYARMEACTTAIKSNVRIARAESSSKSVLNSYLIHIVRILRNGSPHTWRTLADLRPAEDEEGQASGGVPFLCTICTGLLLREDAQAKRSFSRQALDVLEVLLDHNAVPIERTLLLEQDIFQLLKNVITQGQASLQVDYLKLLSKIYSKRQAAITSIQNTAERSSMGTEDAVPTTPLPSRSSSHHDLFEGIKLAIKAPSTQPYLEYWVQFLEQILPVYSRAIFSAMLPLVECFCQQISSVFASLRMISTKSLQPIQQTLISSLPWLLHGLELVVATAHSELQHGVQEVLDLKPGLPSQGLFGNTNSNASKGPMSAGTSKSSRSNSRLTVILCIHDTIKTCFRLWAWGSDQGSTEAACAATTAFNAQRIRNRARKILEHLFAAEGLESLEMLASIWAQKSSVESPPSTVFSLLNVLSGSRPRRTVPLILNSVYSRTNIEALDPARRSTLTRNLTALDTAHFLLQYLETIEDDALDEIWIDCSVFLRDVLSNPMPHRQILPILLEFVALMAEKIDNTNFGELQRMHRDLAVSFICMRTSIQILTRFSGSILETSYCSVHITTWRSSF